MSISRADAEAILAKLIEVQKADPIGALESVNIAGRTFSFKSSEELIEQINYWSAIVAERKRAEAGAGSIRHGRSRAVFN